MKSVSVLPYHSCFDEPYETPEAPNTNRCPPSTAIFSAIQQCRDTEIDVLNRDYTKTRNFGGYIDVVGMSASRVLQAVAYMSIMMQ